MNGKLTGKKKRVKDVQLVSYNNIFNMYDLDFKKKGEYVPILR